VGGAPLTWRSAELALLSCVLQAAALLLLLSGPAACIGSSLDFFSSPHRCVLCMLCCLPVLTVLTLLSALVIACPACRGGAE
jgi:hypothetical protein